MPPRRPRPPSTNALRRSPTLTTPTPTPTPTNNNNNTASPPTGENTHCPLASVVRAHLAFIMRLFDADLSEYNMRQVTTKCLNTAVLTLYMLLGKRALDHTRYCDVENILARRARDTPASFWATMVANIAEVRRQVLRRGRERAPKLFYCMITSAEVPGHGVFPGHVFVIRKSEDGRFDLYQSYIHEFDLNQFMQRNASGGTALPRAKVAAILDGLLDVFQNRPVWDAAASAWWKALSTVDAERFEGYPIRDTLYFCGRVVTVKQCTDTLERLLAQKRAARGTSAADKAEIDVILGKIRGSAAATARGPL
jgi:hypothetical protein